MWPIRIDQNASASTQRMGSWAQLMIINQEARSNFSTTQGFVMKHQIEHERPQAETRELKSTSKEVINRTMQAHATPIQYRKAEILLNFHRE